jgi:hypothetical protein
MLWQWVIVGLIVLAAVAYLLRAVVRSWRGAKTGCGGGCGCGKPAERTSLISSQDLTLRLRSGRSFKKT